MAAKGGNTAEEEVGKGQERRVRKGKAKVGKGETRRQRGFERGDKMKRGQQKTMQARR
jgi:hypothetical protein